MKNIFYVYEHYKPGTDIPLWVGKGCGRRAYSKGKSQRNKWWNNIVNKYGIEIRIVVENLSEIDALWMEVNLITGWGRADLGEGPLVNLTDGGEGLSGYKRSKATNRKLSAIRKKFFIKENHPFFGKTHTKEWKETTKIRQKLWWKLHPDGGHPQSKASKKKISLANKGKKRTKEQNEANRKRNLGKRPWNKGLKLP